MNNIQKTLSCPDNDLERKNLAVAVDAMKVGAAGFAGLSAGCVLTSIVAMGYFPILGAIFALVNSALFVTCLDLFVSSNNIERLFNSRSFSDVSLLTEKQFAREVLQNTLILKPLFERS